MKVKRQGGTLKNAFLPLVLSLFLVSAIAFSVACDDGTRFDIPDDANVFVEVEREISEDPNASLMVFANDFVLNDDDANAPLLMFICPCYLGQNKFGKNLFAVQVANQQIVTMKLLPGAAYNIQEQRLKSGEERSYYFPNKNKQ